MATVNDKMTAIADEIRTLSGVSETLGLDEMTVNLNEANTEINNQTDLISLIQNIIDNLPEAGSGGGSEEQATPIITVNSTGLIIATAGTKSATKQLTTKGATVITPSTSEQTAVDSGIYTTGLITVDPIPNTYVQPATIKESAIYIPGINDQSIAADTYLIGVQTIKGDANLIAENIKKGVSIFDIEGAYEKPDGYIKPSGALTITENGIYNITEYSTVNVNIESVVDNKDLYQRVEYITSAESETYPYIITDFVADNTCGLEIIASFPSMQDRIPMGSRLDSNATRFYCVYPLSTSSCYYGFNTGASISCALSVNTIYRLQTNFMNSRLVNIYDINGIRKGGTSISQTLTQQTCPVAIFGYNRADTEVVSSKREYKLYNARCSRGNEIVREYIPCYRKSDGVIGLYEKYTDQFLTDASGSANGFAKGADIEW